MKTIKDWMLVDSDQYWRYYFPVSPYRLREKVLNATDLPVVEMIGNVVFRHLIQLRQHH